MMTNEAILEKLEVQPLSEEEKSSKHILTRLAGPIASCKEGTRNGRKYNRTLWENALNDEIFKEKVATKSLFLELGHPADREETDMNCVCAVIPEMPRIIGDNLYAVVDVLDTPNGRLLNTLIDYGFVPGISSRGTGDVIGDEVDPETFFLETWDIVQTPALKAARLAVTEGLHRENLSQLKKALCESLRNADADDKTVMKEALNNLSIDVFDELQTNNDSNQEIDVNKSEDESEETIENTNEATDDGSDALIKSLQESLQANIALEQQVKSLQEKLAVSNAKVDELKEEVKKHKSAVSRLSTSVVTYKKLGEKVQSLEESLKEKQQTIESQNAKIKKLSESRNSHSKSLTESISIKDKEIKKLNEELRTQKDSYEKQISELNESIEVLKSDSEKTKTNLSKQLAKVKHLKEGYERLANNTMKHYIEHRATMIGVTVNEIKNKLPESYSVEDVDSVCESLQNYALNISKLPFNVEKTKVRVKVQESKRDPLKLVQSSDGDEIDDSLMSLAGLKD